MLENCHFAATNFAVRGQYGNEFEDEFRDESWATFPLFREIIGAQRIFNFFYNYTLYSLGLKKPIM